MTDNTAHVLEALARRTLHSLAQELLLLGSRIDHASSEEEECALCDQRDAILMVFRMADAARAKEKPDADK